MIVFENPGVIEPEFFSTFGASVKADGAIGYFGTGLKFAIATLLREKQKVKVFSGGLCYDFTLVEKSLRGQPFQMVHMNGATLGFTTELGKDWKLWMAFRELYCNALDEKGEAYESELRKWDVTSGHENSTYIVVEGEKFYSEWCNRWENFIDPARKPLFESQGVQVFPGRSKHIYYKGIRVHDLNLQSRFTYNFTKKIELTEDRTARHPAAFGGDIGKAWLNCTDEKAISEAIECGDYDFEKSIDFHWPWYTPSKEFSAAALRQFQKDSARLPNTVRMMVNKLHPDTKWEECELSKLQQTMLDRAISWAKFLGYDPTEYEIIVVDTLGPEILAEADSENNRMVISKQCFDKGTKILTHALVEETIHLKEGLLDETRGLQTFLFQKILSLAEELRGEPI